MPRRFRKPIAKPSSSTVNNVSSPAFKRSQRGSDVTPIELLRRYLDECPLVAIIRGVTPDEAEAIGDAIFEGGIRIIEVPLNSPDPLKSIERLATKFGETMLVGAGTVLRWSEVHDVKAAGGRLVVSPN